MNYVESLDVATKLHNGDIETLYHQLMKVEELLQPLAIGVVEHPEQNRLRGILSGIQNCRYAAGKLYEHNQVRYSEGIARLYNWQD